MLLIPITTLTISLFQCYHYGRKKRRLMPTGRIPDIWAADNWLLFWKICAVVSFVGGVLVVTL